MRKPEITPEQRIDDALDSIMRASGSALKHYNQYTLERMREAMRKIMTESYIQGSNDCHDAFMRKTKNGG